MLAFLILPILCLLVGLVLLSLGIRDAVTNSTRGYREVTGYLTDYTLQEAGGYDPQRRTETADTYRLVYRYNVDGQAYTLVTSYSTSFVPSRGSETEILYNPKNPAESVIGGPNQSENQLIFIGLFFMFCSLPFFLPFLPKRKQKKDGKQAARRAPSKWAAGRLGRYCDWTFPDRYQLRRACHDHQFLFARRYRALLCGIVPLCASHPASDDRSGLASALQELAVSKKAKAECRTEQTKRERRKRKYRSLIFRYTR